MPGYSSMIHALLLLALLPLAAAQQPWPFCGSGQGTYLARSRYQTNLRNLLTTLRQNASSSPSLFAAGALGAEPDTAWALVLCRGDVSVSDCHDCVTWASRDAERACNRSNDVALCYNQCYVRLSHQNFLDPTSNSGEVHANDSPHIISSDVEHAITTLLNATVQYAVHNSSRLFATGHWVGPDPAYRNIYSAAQCAADLSPPQCQSCLQSLLGRWWTTFPQSGQNARIAGSRCTLRSQLTPFFNGRAMVLLSTTAPTSATGGSRSVAMVIGLVVALVVAASLAACWFWRCRDRSQKQDKTQVKPTGQQIQVTLNASNATTTPSSASTENKNVQQSDSKVDVPRPFSYVELAKATGNFNKSRKLGEGAFGSVYEGSLAGIDRTVAIKEILETSSDRAKKAFDDEVKIMCPLHHRNILRLKGWCSEDKHLLLIYEKMDNGSLEDHLYPRNGTMDTAVYCETDNGTCSNLSWPIRHNIMIGIASGLAYLHKECPDAIVHRDLKPANIMLDRNWNAKLADFGLVTQVRHTQTSRPTDNVIGTLSYIDPAYTETGKVCGQCDVYSLGVVLLEIVCGKRPSILQGSGKNSLIEMVREYDQRNIILDAADKGLMGQFNKEIEAVLQLGLRCVRTYRRPHAGLVRESLMHLPKNGNGSAASTTQSSEGEFRTCRTTLPTNGGSQADEEAGTSRLLSG